MIWAAGCSRCNLLTQAEPLIFYYCEKMIRVLEAVSMIYLDPQQGNTRQRLMEYKVTGLIPVLTFNYRGGTCVNVSSPSTLIRAEIPNGTRDLCWASETAGGRPWWGGEGGTNLTHKFTCLSLGCASSDLNAPLVVCLEGNDSRLHCCLPSRLLHGDTIFALLNHSDSYLRGAFFMWKICEDHTRRRGL